jgi:hypothetical protein
MKVTVIGGGSTYTSELINGFLTRTESFPLTELWHQPVHAVAPGARFVRLTAPLVVGGVLLGMEQVGLNGRAVRERLIETTQVLLNSSVAAELVSAD